ncbi:unnamed protein product [Gordionus sp. m RMFG-2023]
MGFRIITRTLKNSYKLYLGALSVWDTCMLIFNFAVGAGRAIFPFFNDHFMRSPILCSFHGVLIEFFNLQSAWTIVSFSAERLLSIYLPVRFASRNPESRFFAVTIFSFFGNLSFSCLKLLTKGFESNSVFGYAPCIKRNLVTSSRDMAPINVSSVIHSFNYGNHTDSDPSYIAK